MITTLKQSFAFIALALFVSSQATAAPFLQLDILGGTYVGGNEESVIVTDPVFTLFAHAQRGKKLSDSELTSDTFYLSAALTPKDGFDGHGNPDLGSFDVSYTNLSGNVVSETIAVTADMAWGVPPLEPTNHHLHDGGDLGRHDIFDTYFSEFAFKFSGNNTSGVYNVQDDAGQGSIAGTGMYYEAFQFDLTNLHAPYNLHFDLYHNKIKSADDYDVDYHAPFSKDAATAIVVPAPAALILLGAGVMVLGLMRRRQRTTL